MGIYDIYKSVEKQVKKNPRKCECCGAVETMDNLILKWKDGDETVTLCDDCMLERFNEEDLFW